MAQSPEDNAATSEVIRYDLGWNAINSMLRAGRSLSGHERNCCFLNTGSQRYADISGAAGLDFPDDGRVLAVADWDYDGDIDFWIANRSGPQVRYLQNNVERAKPASHFIAFRLEGVQCNRDAIGARLIVETDSQRQIRTLRAGEGYLSQSTKWLHFGLAAETTVNKVTVRWPSGDEQSFDRLSGDQWYTIRQGQEPQAWIPPEDFKPLAAAEFTAPPVSDKARIVLLSPLPLPPLSCVDDTGSRMSLSDTSRGARLVNLWASWCQPCLEELEHWRPHADEFAAAGLEVITLNVDEPSQQAETVPNLLKQLELPFTHAMASEELSALFDVIQRSLLSRQRPLPIPSSFLIDAKGQLRTIYKGPISAATILEDAKLIAAEPSEVLAAATPLPGKWLNPPGGSTPLQLAVKLIEGGDREIAEQYIRSLEETESHHLSSSLLNLRAAILTDKREYQAAAQTYVRSLKLDPNNRQAHIELGDLLLRIRQGRLAEPHFANVLRATPNDPELLLKLGVALLLQGKLAPAQEQLNKALQLRQMPMAHWHLAEIAVSSKDAAGAVAHYEAAIRLSPEMIEQANNLAWLLATSHVAELRNGERAVFVADQVCNAQQPTSAGALDTLAAAYAEESRFDDAVVTAQKALDMARDTDFASEIRNRLELYRQNKPYREAL